MGGAGIIPCRNLIGILAFWSVLYCMFSCPVGINNCLYQRVGRQAVGSMKPCGRDFSHCIEPFDPGLTIHIHFHPTTHIMGCGHYRYQVLGDVDAQRVAFLCNIWEMRLQLTATQVGGIEVDKFMSVDLHFVINGPGHHIPGSQTSAGVVLIHEFLTQLISKNSAIAAHGLSDQVRGRFTRIVEGGGVKLYEFHVFNNALCPVNHSHSIAGGNGRVGGGGI